MRGGGSFGGWALRDGGTYDVHCCAEYVDEVLVGDGGGGEEEVVGYCYVEDGDYTEEEGG